MTASIKFQCACGKKYEVTPEKAGKQGKCSACGQIITIPKAPAAVKQTVGPISSENASVCPFCQNPIEAEEPFTTCPDCSTNYHADCWQLNDGCGVYGCSQAPQTEHLSTLEIPTSYWGQENKPCPSCGKSILAAALRCRHCGATFSAAEPVDENKYHQSQTRKELAPKLQRSIIWVFILCMITPLVSLVIIFVICWYFSKRQAIKELPSLYSAICKIAIYVGIGQTLFIIVVLIVFASWGN